MEDFELLLGNEHTPMRAIQRAAVVINDNTGEVVKNRYGKLPRVGSPEANAIRDAHAAYKAAIGTPDEDATYRNLQRAVEEARGAR